VDKQGRVSIGTRGGGDDLRAESIVHLTIQVGRYVEKASTDDFRDGARTFDAIEISVLKPAQYAGRRMGLMHPSGMPLDPRWRNEGGVYSVSVLSSDLSHPHSQLGTGAFTFDD
jgi:hypothetical protein